MKKYFTSTNIYVKEKYFLPPLCKKPCKSVSIESTLNFKMKTNPKWKKVELNFDPNVRMTKSILKTGTFDVLNNIGSSMGFWLGCSIFSIFQTFKEVGSAFIEIKKSKKKNMLCMFFVLIGVGQFLVAVLVFCRYQF